MTKPIASSHATAASPQPAVIHNTFVLERSYPAAPEKVFAALADPARKRRWFAEADHHEIEKFDMDFRTGGKESARYRFKEGTPFPGAALTHEGSFQDIVPNRRIVIASIMAIEGRTFSASLATFELLPTEKGTDLIFTHQGAFFEGSDGPQRREEGWRKLIDKLGRELAGA